MTKSALEIELNAINKRIARKQFKARKIVRKRALKKRLTTDINAVQSARKVAFTYNRELALRVHLSYLRGLKV